MTRRVFKLLSYDWNSGPGCCFYPALLFEVAQIPTSHPYFPNSEKLYEVGGRRSLLVSGPVMRPELGSCSWLHLNFFFFFSSQVLCGNSFPMLDTNCRLKLPSPSYSCLGSGDFYKINTQRLNINYKLFGCLVYGSGKVLTSYFILF